GPVRSWTGPTQRPDPALRPSQSSRPSRRLSRRRAAQPPGGSPQSRDDLVERLRRTHDRVRLVLGRVVVPAEVDLAALYAEQFACDRVLVLAQRLRDRCDGIGQGLIVGLLRQLLRPEQREVEVAAAVVDLADLARRRLVLLEEGGRRVVQCRGEHARAIVALLVLEVAERLRDREELAHGVPAQVILLDELLDVLRRRAAR